MACRITEGGHNKYNVTEYVTNNLLRFIFLFQILLHVMEL